jgi:hypothetical protein
MAFLPICLLCSLVWLSISENCHELANEKTEVWCGVAMPTKSYFGFDPPLDLELWKRAQAIAASGEPIFAKQIQEVFPHPYDFIDGDKSFRNIENLVDYFIDPKTMFSPISNGVISTRYQRQREKDMKRYDREEVAVVHQDPDRQINLNYSTRTPIIHIGSFRTTRTGRKIF